MSAAPTAYRLGQEAMKLAAVAAVAQHDKAGRSWIVGSLWDNLAKEGAARINALPVHDAPPEPIPGLVTLTVVCRDRSNVRHGYEGVLIYDVLCEPHRNAIYAAVTAARINDLGDDLEPNDQPDMELLFAFAGDLVPAHDWRE